MGLRDHMVGGKKSQHGIGIFPQQQKRRQPNRRRGVSAGGFGDNLQRRNFPKLPEHCRPQVVICDNPKAFGRRERQEARHRLLDHRLLAVERQQLLGAALTA